MAFVFFHDIHNIEENNKLYFIVIAFWWMNTAVFVFDYANIFKADDYICLVDVSHFIDP